MTTPHLESFATIIRQLHADLASLETRATGLDRAPLAGREWYDLLRRKLLPQLTDDAWLVVAVVGGTNIGKSSIFNHLAGFKASAASPLASGTKHPVCLVPAGFAASHDLAAIFPASKLVPWSSFEEPLQSSAENLLFWRQSPEIPPNLLLLDTPDVDSDAPINWERADAIRQSADVLIAILTQQKYNDAAVKKFFRKGGAESKYVILVFNRCELPDDEPYWPIWAETFCSETGISPESLFLVPNDRKRAESLTLPFYERSWPIPANGDNHHSQPAEFSLKSVLSHDRFAEIKLQTLQGSLDYLVHSTLGIPRYLDELAQSSQAFQSAADLMRAHRLAENDRWPILPTSLVVQEIRNWWSARRSGWTGAIHSFYDQVGHWIFMPISSVMGSIQGPQPEPLELFRKREWDAILSTVEAVYERLTWLAELGNDLLKPRLDRLLAGSSRVALLQELEAEHRAIPYEQELRQLIEAELPNFESDRPQLYRFLRNLDSYAAAARPGLTVVLAMTGVGLPLGEAATHLASQSLAQTALHLAGDTIAGTAVATAGEATISATAGGSFGYLQARFQDVQSQFTRQRVDWLAKRLDEKLLGSLSIELHEAASVASSASYLAVRTGCESLAEALRQLTQPEVATN